MGDFWKSTMGMLTAAFGLAAVVVTLLTTLIATGTVEVPNLGDDPPATEEEFFSDNIGIEGTWDFPDHVVDMAYDYTDEDGDDWYLFDSYALDGTQTGEGTAIVSGDSLLILGTDFPTGEYLREFILDQDELPSFP